MIKAVLDVQLFRRLAEGGQVPKWERQRSQEALLMYLEAHAFNDVRQLEIAQTTNRHMVRGEWKPGPYPPLYLSGIYYIREDGEEPWKVGTEFEGKPTEWWQDVYTNFDRGGGDCEDLACHRVAEHRVYYGRQAAPFLTFRKKAGKFHYHVVVLVKNDAGVWRLEDPSRKLGMGWEDTFRTMPLLKRLQIGKMMDSVQEEVSNEKLDRLTPVNWSEVPGQ